MRSGGLLHHSNDDDITLLEEINVHFDSSARFEHALA